MSILHTNNITNRTGTSGPTIAGISTVESTGFLRVPVGNTRSRVVADVENIVTNGLVLYLDAGRVASYGGDGTTWRDLSGQGNNGTLQNGVGFTVDDGGSLIFDGVNDYIIIPSLNLTPSSFSCEAILRFSGSFSIDKNGIFSLNYSYPNSGYLIRTQNNNLIVFSDYGSESQVLSNSTFSSNSIYHIIVTQNANIVSIYINGNLDISASLTNPLLLPSVQSHIGIRGIPIGSYFEGNISIAKVYNRALTASEVLQNYEATKGRYI